MVINTENEPRMQWLFPVVVSIHNLEEAIWLPGFRLRHGSSFPSPLEFRLAALAVAVLAFLATYSSIRRGRGSFASYLFSGFCFLMLLNVFWHVGAAIYLHSYAPGVVTAVLLVLPVATYLLIQAWRRPGAEPV